MQRKLRVILVSAFAALVGVAALFAAVLWLLWKESVSSEEVYAGSLAASLGQSTERIILDTRDLLAGFDELDAERCSKAHLQALEDAAISRPYIRAIGYWRAAERQCSVGFLAQQGLMPAHADRIYDNGVIAWWPSAQTQVAGVQLFLMRYGDHDVAIDPHLLLNLGPKADRQAVLWVEGLRMAAVPPEATLPAPDSLPVGVTIERAQGHVLSHFSRNEILPIDVVAMEPFENFWSRHAQTLLTGAVLGLLLVCGWIYLIWRLSRHELSMATQLRQALAGGRITVQYQPVIDLKSGRCVGAEALARWRRRTGEWVSPGVFVPIAEQVGLIQDITLSVLHTVLRDLPAMVALVPRVSINLNLSPEDFKSDRVGRELAEGLAAANLAAGTIKLEITERALVNSDTSRALIRDFRHRGHQVAIDDFGTGYSSLSYLQSFELDILKIDKSFVDAIGTGAATSQVIVHVIEMAKSLGLGTVAEGVETREQVEWLLEHDVHLGQGFLFSKALAIGDFLEFLRSNHRYAKR